MKVTMTNRAAATHTYLFEAEEGEVLTQEGIEEYLDKEDLAPWGCNICYNTGKKAEVKAYVD